MQAVWLLNVLTSVSLCWGSYLFNFIIVLFMKPRFTAYCDVEIIHKISFLFSELNKTELLMCTWMVKITSLVNIYFQKYILSDAA